MPTIKVGGCLTPATWAEYFFCLLPKGSPVEWRGYADAISIFKNETPQSGVGIFLYCWWYDGVIAEIESGGKRVSLMCALRSTLKVKRLRDTNRLNEQGMHGEGI